MEIHICSDITVYWQNKPIETGTYDTFLESLGPWEYIGIVSRIFGHYQDDQEGGFLSVRFTDLVPLHWNNRENRENNSFFLFSTGTIQVQKKIIYSKIILGTLSTDPVELATVHIP